MGRFLLSPCPSFNHENHMIAEALNFAATWPMTGKAHRPFIGPSVSLWSRARRCAAAWRPHEDNCHRAVAIKAGGMRARRTAVVLGSGLLRDVPIEALAQKFDTVVLIDLVHLASVRAWLSRKRLKNVALIERDLSGYDDLAAGGAVEPLSFLRQVPYLDLVISANLTSQLALGAERRLAHEAAGRMPQDTVARLVSAHMDGLFSLPCTPLLLTDTAFSIVDNSGHVHERHDLLAGIAPPKPFGAWDWTLAPTGEESPDYRIVHHVIAA